MPTPGRRLALMVAGTALAVIAACTLVPLPRQLTESAATPWYCLVCGDQGMVDVLLNVALFVPLGVGLGMLGLRPLRAAATGFLLALAIELLQATLVTGRDASLSDVLTNAGGTLAGAILVTLAPGLWRPSVAAARRLALGAGLAWLALLMGSGWLLTPDRPRTPPSLVRAPVVPFLEPFPGSIVLATSDSSANSWRLHADVVTDRLTDRLAPVLELRDGGHFPLARLGQLGQKPVFSWRLHATRAFLRTPAVRLYGGVLPDAAVPATLEGGKAGPILWAAGTVNGQRHAAELALTPGLGWMLLLPLNYPFDVHSRSTSAVWLALPLLLVGFWAGRARAGFALVIAATALLLLSGLEGTAAVFHLARDGTLAWGMGIGAVVGGWAWGMRREA
ncbi:MAG TPA: VanZ family protein [Gemmatimonadales bacterium]|nr:VanZ family protein [Gemmatimonadales bacterium]